MDSDDSNPAHDTAPFGFQSVPRDAKAGLVRRVFDSVADRYDLMNDLMSGGIHRVWKDILVDRLGVRPGLRLLDVAGGTGDIAFRVIERARRRGVAVEVVVCDINHRMLDVGRRRADDRGLFAGLAWTAGDAERLPVADSSVDAVTVAFGLRNVTDIPAALAEARRVLRPGGRFLCLEFSKVVVPVLDRIYDAYSFAVLPRLGAMVASDAESYRYLAESIRTFPPQEELCAMMEAAGLERCDFRNLSGGIAAIHGGWRL